MNRQTRTLLPMKSALLQPKVPDNIYQRVSESKSRQAHYYNTGARDLDRFSKGDTVRIKPEHSNTWDKGIILSNQSDRSYNVLKENGKVIRRNRKHLRHTEEKFEVRPELQVEPSLERDTKSKPEVKIKPEVNIKPESNGPNPLQSVPTQVQNNVSTRSGRQLIKPTKLKDYITCVKDYVHDMVTPG